MSSVRLPGVVVVLISVVVSDGKKIELSIGANTSEWRAVNNMVRETLASFERLNAEVSKLGKLGGGTGGGRGVGGGGVISTAGVVAGVGRGAQFGAAGSSGGASPIAGLSREMLQSRDVFKAVASGTKDSLRAMTEALRSEGGRQIGEIQRLKKEIGDLNKEYADLKDSAPGTAGHGMARANRERFVAAHAEMGQAMSSRDLAYGRAAQLEAGPPGWAERAGGLLGRMTGLNPAALGIGAAAAWTGRALMTSVTSGMAENQAAPWDWMRRGQTVGQSYGQAGQAAHFGDFRLQLARQHIMADPQLRADREAIGKGLGTALSGFNTAASGGTGFDQEGFRRAQVGVNVFKKFVTGDPLGAVNAGRRGIGGLPYDVAAEQLKFDQAYMEAHPEQFNAASQLMGNYRSDISNMRLFRAGAGRQMADGSRANAGINAARRYENKALLGEAAQAIHGVEAIAGSGTGGAHLASAIAGHLYAAPQIYGQSALGGDPHKFFAATQNLIGRSSGGIDVQAGGRLGSLASGAILSGAGYTNGLGLLGAMSEYARGGSAAGDMANTQFAQQGLGNLNRITGGGLDPYQAGVNLLAATHNAPGVGIFGQEKLARLDARQMADIVAGGAMPGDLKALGISSDMVKGQWGEVQRRMLDRDIGLSPSQDGKANPMQQLMGRLKGYGGDFGALVKGEKLKGGALEDAFSQYGSWLESTGQADNYETGRSMARTLAGVGTLARTSRIAGRGAGDAAGGSTELEYNQAKSELQGKDEAERQRKDSQYRALSGTLAQQEDTYRTAQQQLGGSIQPSVQRVSAELEDLARVIRQVRQKIEGRGAPVTNAGPGAGWTKLNPG